MQIIQTERLRLRPYSLDDAPFVLALFNEPNCLQYIGNKNIYTLDDARNYIKNGPFLCQQQNGFAMRVICARYDMENAQAGQALGACGLLKREHLAFPDLGYAILSTFYRQGITQEAAKAILEHHTQNKTLLALTDTDNIASQQLLLNLGFTFVETQPQPLMPSTIISPENVANSTANSVTQTLQPRVTNVYQLLR